MNNQTIQELAEQAPTDSENVSQVIADHFLSIGDPRGELITLEHEINRMLNHEHRNLKQNQRKLARLQREKEELMGNIEIPLPLYLPQFYSNQIYETIYRDTYTKGIQALRQYLKDKKIENHPTFKLANGSSIYRPLTSEEVIEARVVSYWTFKNPDGSKRSMEDRLILFNDWLDSCTGIAYQGGTPNFKVDLECEKLIDIEEDSNQASLSINYAKEYAESSGEPLDSSDGTYNRDLTFEEFLEHSGHAAAIPDKNLRKAYGEIVFDRWDKALPFYVLQSPDKDQLRSWCVYDLDGRSDVDGDDRLGDYGRFLSVAQMESERSEV